MLARFARFNIVAVLGMAVQLACAAILVSGLHLHYLPGTMLAIEAAILHNFAWHERWTWREARRSACVRHEGSARRRGAWSRCLAFHAGNGCVSLLGSLALLPLLVGTLGLPYLAANVLTIAATGLANFLVADRLVFTA